jgi:hypothetical protein
MFLFYKNEKLSKEYKTKQLFHKRNKIKMCYLFNLIFLFYFLTNKNEKLSKVYKQKNNNL